MRRICAGVAVAALALTAASASAKLGPILALVWKGSGASLTRVDATTLQPVGGAALRIDTTSLVGRSPRGATLAFGTGGGGLAFVDARSLRLRGRPAALR